MERPQLLQLEDSFPPEQIQIKYFRPANGDMAGFYDNFEVDDSEPYDKENPFPIHLVDIKKVLDQINIICHHKSGTTFQTSNRNLDGGFAGYLHKEYNLVLYGTNSAISEAVSDLELLTERRLEEVF